MNIYRSFISAATPFIAIRRRAPPSDRGRRRTAIVPRISRASHTLLYRKYRGAPCTGTARVTLDRPWIVWNSRVDGIVVYSWYDITFQSPLNRWIFVPRCEWSFLGIFNFLEIFSSFLDLFLSFEWKFSLNFQNFFSKNLCSKLNGFLKDLSFLNFLIFLESSCQIAIRFSNFFEVSSTFLNSFIFMNSFMKI